MDISKYTSLEVLLPLSYILLPIWIASKSRVKVNFNFYCYYNSWSKNLMQRIRKVYSIQGLAWLHNNKKLTNVMPNIGVENPAYKEYFKLCVSRRCKRKILKWQVFKVRWNVHIEYMDSDSLNLIKDVVELFYDPWYIDITTKEFDL